MNNLSLAQPTDNAKQHCISLLADLDYDDLADVAAALGRLLADGDGTPDDAALLAACQDVTDEAPPTWLGAPAARPDGRLYGPSGFTRTPAIRAILDPLEGQSYGGGVVPLHGLDAAGINALLALLPASVTADRQNEAPTFAQLALLGRRFPGARFAGYRVAPERWDERVMLDTILIPATQADALLLALRALGCAPEEWDMVGADGRALVGAAPAYWRAWWD